MADTPVQTDPSAKGSKTTEGKLSLATIITGGLAVLAGVITGLEGLRDAFPGVPWIAGVLAVAGTVQMIAVSLGFTHARTKLKVEQLRLDAAAAGERAASLVESNADAATVFARENAAAPTHALRGPTP